MVKLRTFELKKVDIKRDFGLINNLSKNRGVCDYISRDFYGFIMEHLANRDDVIEPGGSYVVYKDGIDIGIIGSKLLSDDGILELWCAIKSDLRNKSYGSKLLWEITIYLIENIKGLEDIELKINKQNFPSIQVALNNGFVYRNEDKTNGLNIYRYFNNNDDSNTKTR